MFGLDIINLFIVVLILLPFFLNIFLARSRGKSVILMLLLTLVFSWVVTLILAFLPKKEQEKILILK